MLLNGKRHQSIMKVLDSYGIRKAFARLPFNSKDTSLIEALCEFQGHIVKDYRRGIKIPVSFELSTHVDAINDIKKILLYGSVSDDEWGALGFYSRDPQSELSKVGVLGLATIHFYVKKYQNEAVDMLMKEARRNPVFRCPIMTAYVQVIILVSQVWGIIGDCNSNYASIAGFQSLFLLFEESFSVAIRTYVKIWRETSAKMNENDQRQVGQLFQAHFRYVINRLDINDHQMMRQYERDMLNVSISTIRSRLLEYNDAESFKEDYFKYYAESFKKQRMNLLLEGSRIGYYFFKLDQTKTKLLYGKIEKNTEPLDFLLTSSIAVDEMIVEAFEDHIVLNDLKMNFKSRHALAEWFDGINILLGKDILHDLSLSYIRDAVNARNCVANLNFELLN